MYTLFFFTEMSQNHFYYSTEAHIIERDTSDFSELNSANGAALATRLAPLAGSLHAALSGALAALPRAHHERRTLRAELSAARDRADRAERRARAGAFRFYVINFYVI